MTQPIQDTTDINKLKQAELSAFEEARLALLAKEGDRPPINDPRRDAKIKSELTQEELAKQQEALELVAKQYLKQHD